MTQILSSDNLFATAYYCGNEVFRFAGSGITSLSDLISIMRDHAPLSAGMVTLNIRNSSQGWSHSRSVYLTHRA